MVVATVATVLAVSSAGCATSGQKGNVTFAYRNVDQTGRAARQPVAAGSELDIQLGPAKEDESGADFSVQGASSSNHDVLEIVSVESGERGSFVRIKAMAPGRATVSVQTSSGDDAVELLVQEVEEVTIAHWFESVTGVSIGRDDVALLRGGRAQFQLRKKSKSGALLAGRGVETHVEARPEGQVEVELPEQETSRFQVRATSGESVTLRGTPGGEERTFDVVALDRVTSLNVVSPRLETKESERPESSKTHPIAFAERSRGERFPKTDSLSSGDKAWLMAVATVADGRRAIALDGLLEAESETPEHCSVRPAATASRGLYGGGLLLVEAGSAGTCRVMATVGSSSASYEFTVTR